MNFRYRWFRAGKSTGCCQTVGTIAPRSDLFEIALVRYTESFGRTNGAIDARCRRPWTLPIRAVLRRRDTWYRISSSTRQSTGTDIFVLRTSTRCHWLSLLTIRCNDYQNVFFPFPFRSNQFLSKRSRKFFENFCKRWNRLNPICHRNDSNRFRNDVLTNINHCTLTYSRSKLRANVFNNNSNARTSSFFARLRSCNRDRERERAERKREKS